MEREKKLKKLQNKGILGLKANYRIKPYNITISNSFEETFTGDLNKSMDHALRRNKNMHINRVFPIPDSSSVYRDQNSLERMK